jgi:hypothetical protein
MRSFTFFVALCMSLLLGSCATIVNRKMQKVHITSEQKGVVVMVDTLKYSLPATIALKRSKSDISLKAILDTSTQYFTIKAKYSNAFLYGNLCWSSAAPLAYLIDLPSKKKFAYPKKMHVDFYKKSLVSKEPVSLYQKFKNDSSTRKCEYNYHIKTSMLSLLNPIFNNAGIGFEKYYGRRSSSQINLRVFTSLREASKVKSLQGYGIDFEQKLFVRQMGNFRAYVAAAVGHDRMTYATRDAFNPLNTFDSLYNKNLTYADDYKISRSLSYLNFKVGFQQYFNHWVVELYGGLGFAYRKVNHSERANMNDVALSPKDMNLQYSLNYPGEYTTMNVPLNLCIGYRFK